jgi:signal transduction histidine kinase
MWYVTFWHVVYLGVLALFLGQVIIAVIREGLSWQSASLMGALLLQAGLYLRIVVFARTWPLSLRQLAAYFGGTLILWFIEWRMEPNFFWLVMSYFGQIYGIAPPPVAIPGSALIFLFVAGESIDWQLARVNGWQAFGWLMGWASFTVLFLFIYHLGNTSEQRAKLIRDLQAAQKELAAARERDAELAALWERERLARDLHDSLGHALVALSVQLEAIQRLYKVDPERASEQVDELKTLTRQSMDDLRRSLAGLRAPGLGDKPLSQSLRVLSVETGQRTGLRVECRVADEADQLSPALAETLWRVAQESLINVGRHAHAREVQIDLQLHPQAVLLRVWDDGVGLPPKAADLPGHYGLRGMRERVEGLGGALTVDSNGQGTVVEARLPLIAEPAQTASSPPGD